MRTITNTIEQLKVCTTATTRQAQIQSPKPDEVSKIWMAYKSRSPDSETFCHGWGCTLYADGQLASDSDAPTVNSTRTSDVSCYDGEQYLRENTAQMQELKTLGLTTLHWSDQAMTQPSGFRIAGSTAQEHIDVGEAGEEAVKMRYFLLGAWVERSSEHARVANWRVRWTQTSCRHSH